MCHPHEIFTMHVELQVVAQHDDAHGRTDPSRSRRVGFGYCQSAGAETMMFTVPAIGVAS
jgi:hypothetical protein